MYNANAPRVKPRGTTGIIYKLKSIYLSIEFK